MFKDADGFATGQAQTLQEITLTGEYKIPAGFIARFEFRNDFSDENFFTNDHDVLKDAADLRDWLDLRVRFKAIGEGSGLRGRA